MSVTFRLATNSNLADIVKIYNEAIPARMATADLQPVSIESRKSWFASFDPKTRPLWIVEDQYETAGWISLSDFYGRAAYQNTAEVSIYIDDSFKHHGLGTQSLSFVFEQLPKLKINTLLAYVFSHNVPSQKLFEKFGFEQWAHLPDIALMDGHKRSLDILGKHFSN